MSDDAQQWAVRRVQRAETVPAPYGPLFVLSPLYRITRLEGQIPDIAAGDRRRAAGPC
ncbi:hypothetical protein [Streptomyces sp. 8N706]|uniref:hypothetical protein n=1 Tax=Streptomyces sp. 8N706 TaxID=3457416 RepID=UPI003FCFCFB7